MGKKIMSKYERLVQPLPCLWLKDSTGFVCGESFTDMRVFSNHVRSQHISSSGSSSGHNLEGWEESGANYNQGVLCGWVGCEQVVLGTYKDYIIHALFHPYHCFLKLLGLEFQVRIKTIKTTPILSLVGGANVLKVLYRIGGSTITRIMLCI